MIRKLFFILAIISFSYTVYSQDTLPRISVTQLGLKALVSWVNPYKNVTTINIQRSGDSLRNFTTIGTVLNASAQTNGFVDQKEFLPNEQYYRLFIAFEGGEYLFTTSHKPAPDTLKTKSELASTTFAPTTPSANEPSKNALPKTPPPPKYFIPSKHIFTGKDNNVVIIVPNSKRKDYSVKFFEDDGSPLFEIKRIAEDSLILDKVNFLHAGLFKFELYEDKKLIEFHKIFIPKDGKPVPLLDPEGYEINNTKKN